MSVVLGLDPCLYLKNPSTLTIEEGYISTGVLSGLIQTAKIEKIKYLYNRWFDHKLPDVINLLNGGSDAFSFVAIMSGDTFKYFDQMNGHEDNERFDVHCDFYEPIQGYISALYAYLQEHYDHGIVISNECKKVDINGTAYNFVTDIADNKELNINMLPAVQNHTDFDRHFSLYHWFYGREAKDIILTNNFITKLNRTENEELFKILTSIFRGIYFPDFMCQYGIPATQNTIEAHNDQYANSMKLGTKDTNLYRIHCVDIGKNNGGKNRIFYTDDGRYTYVFYYDPEHKKKFSIKEDIKDPIIRRYSGNVTLTGTEFALKATK